MAVAPVPGPYHPSLPNAAMDPLQRPPFPPHRLPSFRADSTALDGDSVTSNHVSAPKLVRSRSTTTQHPRFPSSFKSKQAHRVPLLALVKNPHILTSLLAQLSWRACWALLGTCRDCRDFFSFSELKDVILSRFVPGYAICLRISDSVRLQSVPVTLADLHLLMISQTVILHRYPMHALTCLSGLPPDASQVERTSRFAALTQAHSRFVLLLQALAHSSNMPPPPEKEDIEERPPTIESNLRQLEFPAPLSHVTSSIIRPEFSPESTLLSRSGRRGKSADSTRADRTSLATRSLSRPSSRLGLFRNSTPKVPPPPASEPRSLKHYTSGWRHSLSRASESMSDDEWGRKPLERPHRRFASANLSSDSSSFSTNPSSPFSRDSTLGLPSPIRRDTSYHDLSLATSRIRAPILRVFVPCSRLELSDDSDSIPLCEDQLYESGLWDHLSTGDIVCNLGYVPPHSSDEPGSSDGSLPDSAGSDPASKIRLKWLLFDGKSLVPFIPPEPVPLRNPFILPSPRYYMHIMPPLTNPSLLVRCFPPCDDIPQLTLGSLSTKVRSPHSPTGYAQVKKPMWAARVWKQVGDNEEIGLGWQGEWVLQGDGTREGQKVLLDCLRGVRGPPREWQLVREKCNGDRLWFRLIKTYSDKRTSYRLSQTLS
ncbi:hypothetical protein B0H15DRAFT_808183 [Mycena belliarum]|uniref:Uncharacterized protein n=1 Tax=Mycena belliarum TaxID=1033014 RepID=A0AAD6UIB9_9AGAR|nr:hypothetical protein B0H15DRAFT_808183 [Mycena belliae]